MSSQRESKNRQEKNSGTATRPYAVVSYLFLALFLGLIAYMIWFQVFRSRELLNSPYNQRQAEAAEEVIRGSILSADGKTLAATETDAEGNEYSIYPYGSLFAHTVGYQAYGGSGLEALENSSLIVSHEDLVTQVRTDLQEEKKHGDDLITTLRTDLQQTAADSLSGMRGSVFVMETKTGKVLADYSTPGFDPNTIVQDWDALVSDDESGVFLNRAAQGLYPPGSTFKIVTALTYLRQYGSFDGFSYTCTGEEYYGDFSIHCSGYTAHGTETFADAMANSCNCAFAHMAVEMLDMDLLRDTAESLGFNRDPGILLPCMTSEFSLDSRSPMQLAMQTAIGQGDTLATPMQMCMIANAAANDGKMMRPTFVERVESRDGRIVRTEQPSAVGQAMTTGEAAQIREIMRQVVLRGTAFELSGLPYEICGKTGTAEFGDVTQGRAHSWFTGFSNTGGRDITVCVIIEDGGNGYYSATSVAGNIFSAFDAQY